MKTVICVIASIALLLTILPAKAGRYSENFCYESGYQCLTVKRGQSWKSLFPDQYERQVVMRLNRMNVRLHSGMRIAVPSDLKNTDLMDISPFPHAIDAPGEKTVVIDPGSLAWAAYGAKGELIHWGPISGGKGYCSDVDERCRTTIGKYSIYRKHGADCVSRKFPIGRGGAPMPHCMFFKGGYAMHASTTVPGYHASHGCVRMFKEDAKWLNEEFINLPYDSVKGTTVIVNPYID